MPGKIINRNLAEDRPPTHITAERHQIREGDPVKEYLVGALTVHQRSDKGRQRAGVFLAKGAQNCRRDVRLVGEKEKGSANRTQPRSVPAPTSPARSG